MLTATSSELVNSDAFKKAAEALNNSESANQDWSGFTLTRTDPVTNKDSFDIYGVLNWEYEFLTPITYQGNSVYYVPKSYVERGYAFTKPAATVPVLTENDDWFAWYAAHQASLSQANVEWYATPLFLNEQVQQYLKPARLDESLKSAFQTAYAKDRNGYYDANNVYKNRDVITSHIINIPNFDDGYIIDKETFDSFKNPRGGKPVYGNKWLNPTVVPTGMSVVDGKNVYAGSEEFKRGFAFFYIDEQLQGLQQYYEQPRSIGGKFFDSIGLSKVGDLLEGPILSTVLILAGTMSSNPALVNAGLGLSAGNAIRNRNWSQLALTLISANMPNAQGTTLASETMFDIPAIAKSTSTVASTLNVSAATAGLIVQGTIEFVANGFDLKEALKAVAAQYVSNLVSSKVDTILKDSGFKHIATITSNVSGAATKAILLNKPIDTYVREAFFKTVAPIIVNETPGIEKLSDLQKWVLQNAIISKGTNANISTQDLIKGAIVDVAVYGIVNEIPEIQNLDGTSKSLAFEAARALATGSDINATLRNLMVANAKYAVSGQIKNYEAQQEGWKDNNQKIMAQELFGQKYNTKITSDMYKTLVEDWQSVTFNADQDRGITNLDLARDSAIFEGFNNFIFKGQVYTIGGRSLGSAQEFGRTVRTHATPFDGRKEKSNEEAIAKAIKGGYSNVLLPTKIANAFGVVDYHNFYISDETKQSFLRAQEFPGIFDGSKYKTVTEAANAAAAVNENKFLWNGGVHVIKVPESILNQIKNAPTFNEAFALAQKHLGEGNVFEWKDGLFVNRTKEQAAALPFNGNKYEDRGAAAYAAHMAGRDVFTWGGSNWKLPSDYALQVSKALGHDPNQSAAETRRLLDANIKAAPGNILSPDKIRLDQTGVPILDKMIGTYAWIQGRGISAVANQLQLFADGKSILSNERFDTNQLLKMAEEFGQKLQYEDVTKEIERQTNIYFPGLRELAKEKDFLKQSAGFAKLTLENPLAWVGLLVDETAQEALPLAVGLGVGTVTTAGLLALRVPPALAAAAGLNVASITSSILDSFESFASSAKEEIESGTKRETALLVGGANAAITFVTEFVGDKAILAPWMKGAVNKSINEVVKNVLVKPTIVNMVTEGIETFSQGVVTRAIKGEPQNYAEDRVKSMLAMSLAAGVSISLTTPALINGAAQIALDNYGRPVTFDQFMGRDGGGGTSINLSTLNLNTPLLTLNDGSQLTIGGMQLLLPSQGIDRSFINEYTPELRLSRNDDAIFTRQQTFDEAGRFIGYSFAPVKIKDSKPVFERYLIDIGDIPTITETDAKKLLQLEGRSNPTQNEVQQVMDRARDENDRDIAKQIADPFTVSLEEVKEAARAAGYSITDEEAAKYVGERLESEAIPLLMQQFDPLVTTEQEVREFFESYGYSPTQQEIQQFVGSIPEAQIKSQVQAYIDPRMLYPNEVKALAAQEGYEISDARARELSGQKDKYASLNALRAEFDAGAVTLDEARQMFAQTPYKPTDEEIARFVGSKSESQVQQDIKNYIEPRYVTIQDVKDAAAAEGFTITDEQAELLSGQKDKLAAITQFRQDIDPQAVTEAEARAFFNELGYKPTTEELKNFIASRPEQQIKDDISAYVDPRFVTLDEVKKVAAEEGYAISDEEAQALTGQKSQQEILDAFRLKADASAVTQSEAEEFFRELGYQPTPEELQQFIQSKSEQQTRADIAAYVDPRFVTVQEVKDAARAEGYDITDEEAAAIAGQKNQEETIAAFRKEINPKAVTEAEARAFFNELGYKPTQEELIQFIQSRSEAQVKEDLAAYVDPRYVTLEEVKKVAAEEGYDITDEEALALTGQKSQKEILDAFRLKADAGAVLLSEAQEFFRELGYTPNAEELSQFIQSKSEEQIRSDIAAYVDPRYITLEEVKEVARSEGYDLTDEEAAALVGQGKGPSAETIAENILKMAVGRLPVDMKYDINQDGRITAADALGYLKQATEEAGGTLPTYQEETLAKFRQDINPKAVTEAEARAFFNELGYKPTEEELVQFIQSRPEEQIRADISAYVDPRYVTLEEVKQVASEEGYDISDEEALSLTGQKSQQEILDALRTRADSLAVLESEAREFFAALNYNPTEEEIAQFIGSRSEEDVRSELAAYVDPRYVTLEEIKEAARAEGYDLTDEEAAALIGQKNQEETISAFRSEINPKAVIEAEAQAFFAQFGYAPTAEELSQFIVSRPEEQVLEDIQKYIDPRQVTREEAEARFRDIQSEYQFTPEEIEQFIRAGIDVSQEGVLDEIAAYIDPRYVTPEEVKARYAELGFTTPMEEDVSRFAGQKDQATTQEEIQQYLPTAQYNFTAKQLADLQAEQARQKQIQDLNTKFTQDVQALINADPYIDIQTAIEQTIGKIDDPEQRKLIDPTAPPITSLIEQQATKKAARQQQAQQLRQQGMDMFGVPPTDPAVTSEPHKMDLESLYTGDPGDAFISPLAPYLAKVQQESYTDQQPSVEQPFAEPKDLTDMKRREQGYFTYGQPSEIDQNLAAAADPFGFYTAAAMAGGMRAGGLVPPLMAAGGTTRYGQYAGGGLNLVPHTGKMRVDFRQGDAVTGEGDGQSDDIPAMLADGEFVIPADVVAALGNGSTKAGSDKLYDMMHSIRAEHRSADPKSLPPPAKSPLDYVSKRPRAKKRR